MNSFRYALLIARENAGGALVVAVLLAGFAAVGFLGYSEFVASRKLNGYMIAEIVQLTQVPQPGRHASAARPWLADVKLGRNSIVSAEFPFLPKAGQRVCIEHTESRFLGSRYQAIGYVDSMERVGALCGDTGVRR